MKSLKKYKKADKSGLDRRQLILLILVFVGVVIAWVINANNVYDAKGNDLGVYGDKFGAVNALFSGLAFAGIIFTILLQRNELKLQREESREARKEFTQQNFENTFFNLLKNQQLILSKISGKSLIIDKHVTDISSISGSGAGFFILAKHEMLRIMEALRYKTSEYYDHEYFSSIPPELVQHPDEEDEDYSLAKHSYTNYYYEITQEIWKKSKTKNVSDFCRLSYVIFFTKYHHIIGHYFRHIYHIFKFLSASEESEVRDALDEQDENEIRQKYHSYAQFVQAQMSAPELLLLYYNSLAYEKARTLLVKYEILNNVNIQDLIRPDQNVIPNTKLKNRKDLLDF